MKFSLLCIYLLEDIEEHCVYDLIKAYKELGDTSELILEHSFRRGLTISFYKGKLRLVRWLVDFAFLALFRCVHASLYEALSVRWSVGHAFVKINEKWPFMDSK